VPPAARPPAAHKRRSRTAARSRAADFRRLSAALQALTTASAGCLRCRDQRRSERRAEHCGSRSHSRARSTVRFARVSASVPAGRRPCHPNSGSLSPSRRASGLGGRGCVPLVLCPVVSARPAAVRGFGVPFLPLSPLSPPRKKGRERHRAKAGRKRRAEALTRADAGAGGGRAETHGRRGTEREASDKGPR